MTKKLFLLAMAWLAFALPLSAELAPFTLSQQFSATETITGPAGKTTVHIFVATGMFRVVTVKGSVTKIHIVRLDKQKQYLLHPVEKTFQVSGYFSTETPGTVPSGQWTAAGAFVVQGIACTKYVFTNGAGKKKDYWVSADGHLVRVAAEDHSYMEVYSLWTDGAPDASNFTVPPVGYTYAPGYGAN